MLVANGTVSPCEMYAPIRTATIYPADCDSITVEKDSVILKKDDLYEISVDAEYTNQKAENASVQLEINGVPVNAAMRMLCVNQVGVAFSYYYKATAGDEVKVRLNGIGCITALVVNLAIKHYTQPECED
ncbi:MAG: hypothetical protein ACI4MH_06295 [Candidatus Coproplasma sp.]